MLKKKSKKKNKDEKKKKKSDNKKEEPNINKMDHDQKKEFLRRKLINGPKIESLSEVIIKYTNIAYEAKTL